MLDIVINRFIQFFIVFFPIFFLPVTADAIELPKMILLIIVSLSLCFLLGLKAVITKKITIRKSSFILPLFFLSGIYLIGSLIQSPNLTVSLTTPLSTATVIAGFLLYLSLISTTKPREHGILMGLVILAAVIISFWALAVFTGIIPFSKLGPAGSFLSTAIFLSIICVYLLGTLINFDKLRGQNRLIYIIALFIITASLATLVFHLLTDNKPIILPYYFGWSVFLETLKNFKSLFLGVGPANFLPAFTLTKPLSFNSSPYWNVLFTTSSSYILNLATETGIPGVILYLSIFTKTILLIKSSFTPLRLALLLSLVISLLLPINITVFILVIVLLAFSAKEEPEYAFNLFRTGILNYVLFLPVIFFTVSGLYLTGRVFLAEVAFKSSLDASVNNMGTDAYNYMRDAVILNPYLDRYHLAFSQLNLALANALAGKNELTDTDKQNIPRLIQQSIDEGRSAAALYRINPVNWENLGNTYQSLINFAPGSENWAVESYKQKLVLDPYNPNNYLSLGKLYVRMKKYEDAEIFLQQAVNLKPDLATPHYVLGSVYRLQKKYPDAYRELQTALAYLTPSTDDAQKVNQELQTISKLLPGDIPAIKTEIETSDQLHNQSLEDIGSTPAAFPRFNKLLPTISLEKPPD